MDRVFYALLTLGLFAGYFPPARAHAQAPASALVLSSAASGKRVEEYFRAFNSGDEKVMAGFITNNIAPASLSQTTVAERLERYRQLRQTAETLTVRKVMEVREDRVTLVAEAKTGMSFRMEFQFQTEAPHLLLMVKLMPAQGSEAGVTRLNDEHALATTLESALERADHAGEFSGVVLVARRDRVVFEKAVGKADREKRIPNTLETRFNIGSINKHFTKVAIYQLAAAGKLSLADKIGRFLPDYPNRDAAQKVTIKHLLDMSSGIGDLFGDRYDATPKEKLNSISAYLPLFADQPLEFEPGAKRRYSNGGFIVLGAIIEKVSGTNYYAWVRDHILEPAGMARSGFFEKTSNNRDIALGYTSKQRDGKRTPVLVRNDWMLPQRGSSAGGGYSTAHDLLLYTRALKLATITPPRFEDANGSALAGGTEGANAVVDWNGDSGWTIIVLSNFDPPSAEKLAQQISGWLPEK